MCKTLTEAPPQGYYLAPIRNQEGRMLWWVVLIEEREGPHIMGYSQLADTHGRVSRFRGPTTAVRAAHAFENKRLRAELERLRSVAKRAPVAESQPVAVYS